MIVVPAGDYELIAYIDGVRIGRFRQDAHGATVFRYDDAVDPLGTPLSIAMPLVPGAEYSNRVVRPYLQGLLSDSPATLAALAARFHTTAGSPMNLLGHVGRDTAGALQLLPPGIASDDAAERIGDIAWIEDVEELIAEVAGDVAEWTRTRDDIRWSLAGAQPKLALHRAEDGRWGVPRDSTPTTHILKPAARGGRHDVNEFLAMRAARHLGLDVADHDVFATSRGDHVFVARRYDRAVVNGRLARLHQEDFAQALSVEPAHKYQADGGPGVSDFARVLTAMPRSVHARARRSLFDALVFSVAALNTDAHAKNYSVVHLGTQMQLAPLYDLGSNALYRGDAPLVSAVTLGGERRMDRIGRSQFEKVAGTLKVDAGEAAERVEHITSGVVAAFSAARHDLVADSEGLEYADRLLDALAERAKARGWTAS